MNTDILAPIMKISGGRVVEFNPSKEWVDYLLKKQWQYVDVRNSSDIGEWDLSQIVCSYINEQYMEESCFKVRYNGYHYNIHEDQNDYCKTLKMKVVNLG